MVPGSPSTPLLEPRKLRRFIHSLTFAINSFIVTPILNPATEVDRQSVVAGRIFQIDTALRFESRPAARPTRRTHRNTSICRLSAPGRFVNWTAPRIALLEAGSVRAARTRDGRRRLIGKRSQT